MRTLDKCRLRLRSLFRRNRVDSELDAELQFHIDRQIEENLASGMSKDEARYAAIRSTGNLPYLKEESREARGLGLLDSLTFDLRYAIRRLRREKGFAIGAVLILTLGIGATTAVFSVVNSVLLKPLPYRAPDRLFSVVEFIPQLGETFPEVPVNLRHFMEWKECPCFQDVALSDDLQINLTASGEPERLAASRVTANFFAVLGVEAQRGRLFLEPDGAAGSQDLVVLTDRLWRRRFGADPAIIGQSIEVNSVPRIVVGILPASYRHYTHRVLDPALATSRVDVYLVWRVSEAELPRWAGNFNFAAVARLNEDRSPDRALSELNSIQREIATRFEADFGTADLEARLIPLRELTTRLSRIPLLVLFGAVVVVLAIAFMNLANLMLLRVAKQRGERTLRAALGASKLSIVRSTVVESSLLSVAGSLCGLGLAWLLLRAFVPFIPVNLPRADEVGFDWSTFAFVAACGIAAVSFFGAFPAVRTLWADANPSSGRSHTEDRERIVSRELLSGGEIALSVMLLVAAGLLMVSFMRLQGVDRGFNAENVLTAQISLPPSRYPDQDGRLHFYESLLAELETRPGVVSAGVSSVLPLQGYDWGDAAFAENDTRSALAETAIVQYRAASPGYFESLGIPLTAGRAFVDTDAPGRVAVMSEGIARTTWPVDDPIGRRFSTDPASNDFFRVVGVVPDLYMRDLADDPEPLVHVPLWVRATPTASVVVRTSFSAASASSALREAVSSLDPELPLADVQTMTQIVESSLAERRFIAVLIAAFAVSSLSLAAVGVFSVLGYSVAQRTREIAIRMAVGASRANVLALILGQVLRTVVIGVGIGILGALGLGRILSGMIYGINPTDPTIFLSVCVTTVAIALFACWLPARRAAKVDPMVALRHE